MKINLSEWFDEALDKYPPALVGLVWVVLFPIRMIILFLFGLILPARSYDNGLGAKLIDILGFE